MKRRSTPGRNPGATARDRDLWQVQEIHAALAELKEGRHVPHALVVTWLRSWGKRHERQAPSA